MFVPFNRPLLTGKELDFISKAIDNGHLSGNGPFSKKCQEWIEKEIGCCRSLMTHSCTGALEMAALLADIQTGHEVILPSFTFVSTASAFVLRGATPVFVDIRADTLNLDESKISGAITENTRAIVPVHYAGVGCEMDHIGYLARENNLLLIEDAAHSFLAKYKGRPLGSIGDLATFSFHETKNVTSGEGGSLILNDPEWVERAEIILEKGTDRSRFFRGEVDKYTWVDLGSSFLMSEINAAFLWSQLQKAYSFVESRIAIWERYHEAFVRLELQGKLRRPIVPPHCTHNAHIYYILLPDRKERDRILAALKVAGVNAVFHYAPLHSSPSGKKYGRTYGDLSITDSVSERLLRLPLWFGMTESAVNHVIDSVYKATR